MKIFLRTLLTNVAALTFTLMASVTAKADIAVIVSPQSAARHLSREDVADIFLRKSTRLPGGERVEPLDQNEGSGSRDAFYRSLLGKNPTQVKAFWIHQIFAGRATPPLQAGNDADIKTIISSTPGQIGYIDRKDVDDTVKVMLILP